MTSPLERCAETAEAIAAAQAQAGRDPRGTSTTGSSSAATATGPAAPIKDLAKDPLWKVVQAQPSAARFPAGEALAEMSARAVAAVRDWDARLGDDAVWVACSHGDVIKAILADALGLHLDQFQRIVVDPCSVSVDPLHRRPGRTCCASTTSAATSPRSRPPEATARGAGAVRRRRPSAAARAAASGLTSGVRG